MDLPQLFYRGIVDVFSSVFGVVTLIVLTIFLIFYIYLPFDIIPDHIGIFGLIDDFIMLIGIVVWVVERIYSGFRDQVNLDYENIIAR